MKKLLIGLTFSVSTYATDINEYMKNLNEVSVMLKELASKTTVSNCRIKKAVTVYDSQSKIEHACISGESEIAKKAESCAKNKVIQVCIAKGLSNCKITATTTMYSYRFKSSCVATVALTIP